MNEDMIDVETNHIQQECYFCRTITSEGIYCPNCGQFVCDDCYYILQYCPLCFEVF